MFYPIPSLDNKYEINKKGVVRNAKTKRIKAIAIGTTSYHFYINNLNVWICQAALLAEVFDKSENFQPIPSFNGKYEIDKSGIVRNSKTKKVLTPRKIHSCAMVDLYFEGKQKSYSVPQLLWEVFGRTPKLANKPAIPVYLSRDGRNLYFTSIYKAARFLSKNLCYTVDAMDKRLRQRQAEIYGWKVFYREPEKRVLKSTCVINGDKYLRRENKYWNEVQK